MFRRTPTVFDRDLNYEQRPTVTRSTLLETQSIPKRELLPKRVGSLILTNPYERRGPLSTRLSPSAGSYLC